MRERSISALKNLESFEFRLARGDKHSANVFNILSITPGFEPPTNDLQPKNVSRMKTLKENICVRINYI